MKTHKLLLLFYDHFHCLDDLYATGDVVPSTETIRIHESKFKLFV